MGLWVRCSWMCFQYRMKNEYGVDLRMRSALRNRLIDEYPGDLSDMNLGSDGNCWRITVAATCCVHLLLVH